MKLVVIGLGQCGGRVADEFARLNRKALSQRGMEIVAGTFAINTDVADLSGLSSITPDSQHRILIGGQKTSGHGVGKINELGAEVAKEDADKVVDTVRASKRLSMVDAFLLVAGAAGGTGSGAIPVITQQIKEHFKDKPVYNLIVLPFRHEEQTEERAVYNVATCLKSSYLVADAVILVDNQRYISKESSIQTNLAKINTLSFRNVKKGLLSHPGIVRTGFTFYQIKISETLLIKVIYHSPACLIAIHIQLINFPRRVIIIN